MIWGKKENLKIQNSKLYASQLPWTALLVDENVVSVEWFSVALLGLNDFIENVWVKRTNIRELMEYNERKMHVNLRIFFSVIWKKNGVLDAIKFQNAFPAFSQFLNVFIDFYDCHVCKYIINRRSASGKCVHKKTRTELKDHSKLQIDTASVHLIHVLSMFRIA